MDLYPLEPTTIVSYNASAVKIYRSLVRFENKNIFFYLKNALANYNAAVVAVVRLAPGNPDPKFPFF
jgi:hypothetical protein